MKALPPESKLEIADLTAARFVDFEAVFAPADGCEGCWCLNHHIAAGEPDCVGAAARAAKQSRVEAGTSRGLLAYLGGEPVGWAGLDRPQDIPGHDCAPAAAPGLWALHCLYLQPRARGRGVFAALLVASEAAVSRWGGSSIEAYSLPAVGEGYEFLPPRRAYEARGYTPRPSPDPAYGVWFKAL